MDALRSAVRFAEQVAKFTTGMHLLRQLSNPPEELRDLMGEALG